MSLSRPSETPLLEVTSANSKVPEVTVLFWIVKVLTTGMGETTSDSLVTTIDPMVAVMLGGIAFTIALILQLATSRYITWIYWLAIVMVAVFGTMAADVVHVAIGVPYAVSTPIFAIVLVVVFAAWHRCEGTLSIHSIHSIRRELFYWMTVSTTFALGTAAGDLTATTLGLGYLESGILFATAIAVPAIAYWQFGLPAIPAFWIAYLLTRPLGASFADWMGVNAARGGLNWGTGYVSLSLAILIIGLVAYSSMLVTRKGSLSRLKAIVFTPFALAILVLKPEWFVPNGDYDDPA